MHYIVSSSLSHSLSFIRAVSFFFLELQPNSSQKSLISHLTLISSFAALHLSFIMLLVFSLNFGFVIASAFFSVQWMLLMHQNEWLEACVLALRANEYCGLLICSCASSVFGPKMQLLHDEQHKQTTTSARDSFIWYEIVRNNWKLFQVFILWASVDLGFDVLKILIPKRKDLIFFSSFVFLCHCGMAYMVANDCNYHKTKKKIKRKIKPNLKV